MSQNVIRVYNVSAEKTGEGFPLMIDYAGTTYIFQPSDSTWERKLSIENFVDRGQGFVSRSKRYDWVKKEDNDTPNYVDISPAMATWLFEAGMEPVHKNALKTGTEMQDIVDEQLKKKQKALEKLEEQLEIAEKKASSKKRGTGRTSKAAQAQA